MQGGRPLFAQGLVYDSPPHSPSPRSPGQVSGHLATNQSPGGYPRSPYPQSPRFSTPVHGNHPRPPKFPRPNRGGSPRSPWQSPGVQWQSPRYLGPRHNIRSSGSRDSSWVSSPRSQFQSPRFGGGSVDGYIKDSMVEDPWVTLELQRPAMVRVLPQTELRDNQHPTPKHARLDGHPSQTNDSEWPAALPATDLDPAPLKPVDSSESTDLMDLKLKALEPSDSKLVNHLEPTNDASLPPANPTQVHDLNP